MGQSWTGQLPFRFLESSMDPISSIGISRLGHSCRALLATVNGMLNCWHPLPPPPPLPLSADDQHSASGRDPLFVLMCQYLYSDTHIAPALIVTLIQRKATKYNCILYRPLRQMIELISSYRAIFDHQINSFR